MSSAWKTGPDKNSCMMEELVTCHSWCSLENNVAKSLASAQIGSTGGASSCEWHLNPYDKIPKKNVLTGTSLLAKSAPNRPRSPRPRCQMSRSSCPSAKRKSRLIRTPSEKYTRMPKMNSTRGQKRSTLMRTHFKAWLAFPSPQNGITSFSPGLPLEILMRPTRIS